MPRKTETVVIKEEGRDRYKCYFLTEMPASRAEKWACRVLSALARSVVTIPPEVSALLGGGWAALSMVGVKVLAGMSFDEMEPLLDEMMGCVKIIRDPQHPTVMQDLIETPDMSDIEEVATRIRLRVEIFKLHSGFFLQENGWSSALGLGASAMPVRPTPSAPTSPGASPPS